MSLKREAGWESGSSQPAILVLGLGNPLRGDDGVGARVIKELQNCNLPKGVIAEEWISDGVGLLQIIEEGWDHILVVDSAKIGLQPGKFMRFTSDRVNLKDRSFSPHRASLAEALNLAKALDKKLPPITIFGIQPAEITWGEELSPVIQNVVPDLVNSILKEINCIRRS